MRDLQQIASDVTERWEIVKNFPDYAVSNMGRVKRLTSRTFAKAGSILKACPRDRKRTSGGYLSVDLCRDGKRSTHMVHRLVAQAFLGPAVDGMEVNHISGVVSDNRLANLEYVTSSENQRHAYQTGLQSATGELNGQAKLTEADVIAIRQHRGEPKGIYAKLSRQYGVSSTTIRDAMVGRCWSHIPL